MITHIIIKWLNIICIFVPAHTHSHTRKHKKANRKKELSLLISNIKYWKCRFEHVHHISFLSSLLLSLPHTSYFFRKNCVLWSQQRLSPLSSFVFVLFLKSFEFNCLAFYAWFVPVVTIIPFKKFIAHSTKIVHPKVKEPAKLNHTKQNVFTLFA